MPITLPTTKTTVDLKPEEGVVLLYGPPKVGKTSMVVEFDNVMFLATENRHKQFNVFIRYPKDWLEFKEYVDLLEDNCPYKTIAIDTIGDVWEMCSRHVCEEQGIEDLGDLGFGKGYAMAKAEFKGAIQRLTKIPGVGCWFIAHAKKVDIKTSIKELTTVEPHLTGTARSVILPLADQILFMGVDTYSKKVTGKDGNDSMVKFQERTMLAAPKQDIEAGDSFGILPPKFRLGSTPRSAFENYVQYFKEPYTETEPKPKKKKKKRKAE